jgi:hypothetical protein
MLGTWNVQRGEPYDGCVGSEGALGTIEPNSLFEHALVRLLIAVYEC